jgi:hypothetical protein
VVEDLVPPGEETPPEKRDLDEELMVKTGLIWAVDLPVMQHFELVDMSDDVNGVVYVTVGFVPPPAVKGKEPLGDGKFTMTYRVTKGEAVLADWLAE